MHLPSFPASFLRLPHFIKVGGGLSRHKHGEVYESTSLTQNDYQEISDMCHVIWRERIGGAFWHENRDLTAYDLLIVFPSLWRDAQIFWQILEHEIALYNPNSVRFLFPEIHHLDDEKRWESWRKELLLLGFRVKYAPYQPHKLIEASAKIYTASLDDYALLGFSAKKTVFVWQIEDNFKILSLKDVAELLLLKTIYYEPYTQKLTSLRKTVDFLSLIKKQLEENKDIVACLGISWWKRQRIGDFFIQPTGERPRFFYSTKGAFKYAINKGGAVAIWSNIFTNALEEEANKKHIPLVILDDGFIRSLGLGKSFLPPSSIIYDKRGYYGNFNKESDLEHLLAHYYFTDDIKQRAESLIERLRKEHISKYAIGEGQEEALSLPQRDKVNEIILVPGQVWDGCAYDYQEGGIKSNLDLLKEVRKHHPESWIIYRPHPEVEAGYQSGILSEDLIYQYANIIDHKNSISFILEHVDSIHCFSSLTGFEGLLRGRKVVTYGAPFYAGWGLTIDRGPILERRGRSLEISELAAGALILYPRYVDPLWGAPCTPEHFLDCLHHAKIWEPSMLMRLRSLQGRTRKYLENFIIRISRLF